MDIKNQNNQQLIKLMHDLNQKHEIIKQEIAYKIDQMDKIEADYLEIAKLLHERVNG